MTSLGHSCVAALLLLLPLMTLHKFDGFGGGALCKKKKEDRKEFLRIFDPSIFDRLIYCSTVVCSTLRKILIMVFLVESAKWIKKVGQDLFFTSEQNISPVG